MGKISPLYSKSMAMLLFHLLMKFLIANEMDKELALSPDLGPNF